MNRLLYFMLTVVIIVPFSNDIFVSGMPQMAVYFHTQHTSMLLTIFLFGLALVQPVYGPLSDRFGRRPILLVGLWIYTLSSAAIMLSPSFDGLIVGRLFQAFGACSIIVTVLAIIRDVSSKDKIVKAVSLIMMIIGVCPAIAPLLGGYLTEFFGWRFSFVFLFFLGLFFTALIQSFFTETIVEKNTQAMHIKQMIVNYKRLMKDREIINCCITSAFSYGVLFSYFAISSFFIISKFHVSAGDYGWIVALNAIAIVSMAYLAPKIAAKFSLSKTMLLGSFLLTTGGVLMWLSNMHSSENTYAFILPMFISTMGIGMIRPTASGGAMRAAPSSIAGSASALFNFFSFIGGSIAVALSTLLVHSPFQFGIFIIVFGGCALMISVFNLKAPSPDIA